MFIQAFNFATTLITSVDMLLPTEEVSLTSGLSFSSRLAFLTFKGIELL